MERSKGIWWREVRVFSGETEGVQWREVRVFSGER